ncbi:hypothetical protein J2W28_002094 [Variovorax boronicumulans]|nr:hypothetical protein [Variovorax boronicumulans]MDQ0002952.1 hypothetical protein [Variovorax boronicumulans]
MTSRYHSAMHSPYKPAPVSDPTRADVVALDVDVPSVLRAQFWASMHRRVEAGEVVFVPNERPDCRVGTLLRPSASLD